MTGHTGHKLMNTGFARDWFVASPRFTGHKIKPCLPGSSAEVLFSCDDSDDSNDRLINTGFARHHCVITPRFCDDKTSLESGLKGRSNPAVSGQ